MKKLTVDDMACAFAAESALARTGTERHVSRESFKGGWYAALESRDPKVRAFYNEQEKEMPAEKTVMEVHRLCLRHLMTIPPSKRKRVLAALQIVLEEEEYEGPDR